MKPEDIAELFPDPKKALPVIRKFLPMIQKELSKTEVIPYSSRSAMGKSLRKFFDDPRSTSFESYAYFSVTEVVHGWSKDLWDPSKYGVGSLTNSIIKVLKDMMRLSPVVTGRIQDIVDVPIRKAAREAGHRAWYSDGTIGLVRANEKGVPLGVLLTYGYFPFKEERIGNVQLRVSEDHMLISNRLVFVLFRKYE